MKTAEPIRDTKLLCKFLDYYKKLGQHRNSLLLHLGVHTALRISDILSLKFGDVYDFKNRRVRSTIEITEKKTQKPKIIALHKNVRSVLLHYIAASPQASPGTPLILNSRTNKPISRVQAFRLISTAAVEVGIPHSVSCHSLRKTFGYHLSKTGTPPTVIMEIYNHSSYTITKRYTGINQDEINSTYLGLDFT